MPRPTPSTGVPDHPARMQLAVRTDEHFLQTRNLCRLPVDPLALATSLDIVVKTKPETANGVTGMLLGRGTSFAILSFSYVTHIDNADAMSPG